MKVLVSGASGLVGGALVERLMARGDRVGRLVRSRVADDAAVWWDPATGQLESARLEGWDAVVHLAGENIAARRWTSRQKAKIADSRVVGTSVLSTVLAALEQPPSVLVCASAVGYYGDRGDELLDEDSSSGQGFLAALGRQWEAAAAPAVQRGIRVVHLRFGIVLSERGGALVKMLLPFKLGLGGKLGNGRQYFSWIALDDAVEVIIHAVETAQLRGSINAVSPEPVTNGEFTRALGRTLKRPTLLSVPASVLRLAIGEMADEALLASTRVRPKYLVDADFEFQYTDIEKTLQHLLGADLTP